MKCYHCGKEFKAGTKPSGIPNGVGFELEDGKIITVCSDCIMEVGREKVIEGIKEKQN